MRNEYYKDLTDGKELSMEARSKAVHDNWENVAKEFGNREDATIRDLCLRALNTEKTCKYLCHTDKIIDVGCGNGFATAEYSKHVRSAVGVDYIPEFVSQANRLHKDHDNLRFVVGDIRDLSSVKDTYGKFDKVIAERTLINLASWDEQKKAILELDSLLVPYGLMILTEVTVQGHESVDKIRTSIGLPIIEKHWNNVYIDEDRLRGVFGTAYTFVTRESFGLYSLISKVVYPYLIYPEEPKFDASINKLAAELDQLFEIRNEIGHQVFWVFRKVCDIMPLEKGL